MCLAKTAGRRKYVSVVWKSTLQTRPMPQSWQKENSAKPRRCAIGHCVPTEFRSRTPIFRPEQVAIVRKGRGTLRWIRLRNRITIDPVHRQIPHACTQQIRALERGKGPHQYQRVTYQPEA